MKARQPRQDAEAAAEPRQPVGRRALELEPQQRLAKGLQQRQRELLLALEDGARDVERHRAEAGARRARGEEHVEGQLLEHDDDQLRR